MENILNSANTTLKSWVEMYSDNLYSWALYKTSNKETAEDLVQETFLAAHQSLAKFKEQSNPKTWLLSILNHKIVDYYRSKSKKLDLDSNSLLEKFYDSDGSWRKEERPQQWPDENGNFLDDEEFQKTLERCLEKLPASWNSAVQLKYLQEKNAESICQELNISSTNYWQMLHRAKLQLRKCLEINWFIK